MATSTPSKASAAPRAALLLPVAYVLHFAEEWFGGFTTWAQDAPGFELTPERLLAINAPAFVLFVAGTLATFLSPRMAWIATSLAALFGLNGILHTLATVGMGRYAPGTVTGLLLFIPLSVVVLRSSRARLSRAAFAGSIAFGVALHGLATLLALS